MDVSDPRFVVTLHNYNRIIIQRWETNFILSDIKNIIKILPFNSFPNNKAPDARTQIKIIITHVV